MKILPIQQINNTKKNNITKQSNQNFKGNFMVSNPKPPKIRGFVTALFLALATLQGAVISYNTNKARETSTQMVPIRSSFETQEASLNYAIEIISRELRENNKEYSVHINNNLHRIISEASGTDSSVVNYAPLKQLGHDLITPNYSYTMLHGHPAEKDGSTTTFSLTDIKNFLAIDDCTATYVVNKDGKYCKMEKTADYKKPSKKEIEEIEEKYDFFFRAAWPQRKIVLNKKGKVLLDLIDYPGMHDYLNNLTKKFGIKYSTTFGTYGLYGNIYSNGYHEGFNENLEVVE